MNLAEEAIEETDSTELRDELRQAEEMFARVRSTVESEATGVEQKIASVQALYKKSLLPKNCKLCPKITNGCLGY